MPDQSTPASDTPSPGTIRGPLVEQSVNLPTTSAVVWQLITTPTGVAGWYTVGGGAELEPTVGAQVKLWWEQDTAFLGRVVTADAPHRFDYRLAHGINVSPQVAPSTLVQFKITESPDDPGECMITVRESGFDLLDDPKEAFTQSSLAWIGALGLLQRLVSRLNEARGRSTPASTT